MHAGDEDEFTRSVIGTNGDIEMKELIQKSSETAELVIVVII